MRRSFDLRSLRWTERESQREQPAELAKDRKAGPTTFDQHAERFAVLFNQRQQISRYRVVVVQLFQKPKATRHQPPSAKTLINPKLAQITESDLAPVDEHRSRRAASHSDDPIAGSRHQRLASPTHRRATGEVIRLAFESHCHSTGHGVRGQQSSDGRVVIRFGKLNLKVHLAFKRSSMRVTQSALIRAAVNELL